MYNKKLTVYKFGCPRGRSYNVSNVGRVCVCFFDGLFINEENYPLPLIRVNP